MEELVIRGAPVAPKTEVVIQKLPIKSISLGKNSRLQFDDDEMSGLMQSIKEEGLLQPIGVVDLGNGSYEVAYGNRRYIACKKLGLKSIPALIHQCENASDIDIKNLTENVQRKNTSFAEVGRYILLLEAEGLSRREIAARLGKTAGYVQQCANAFGQVPEEFREDIISQMPGAPKHQKGKIRVDIANTVINAWKRGIITKPNVKKILRDAKKNPMLSSEDIRQRIGDRAKAGSIEGKKMVKGKTFACFFRLSEKEIDRLDKKYIRKGSHKTVVSIARDILSGDLVETLDVLKGT